MGPPSVNPFHPPKEVMEEKRRRDGVVRASLTPDPPRNVGRGRGDSQHLSTLLESLDLPELSPLLRGQAINYSGLLTLGEKDLLHMGVKEREARALLDHIQEARRSMVRALMQLT